MKTEVRKKIICSKMNDPSNFQNKLSWWPKEDRKWKPCATRRMCRMTSECRLSRSMKKEQAKVSQSRIQIKRINNRRQKESLMLQRYIYPCYVGCQNHELRQIWCCESRNVNNVNLDILESAINWNGSFHIRVASDLLWWARKSKNWYKHHY